MENPTTFGSIEDGHESAEAREYLEKFFEGKFLSIVFNEISSISGVEISYYNVQMIDGSLHLVGVFKHGDQFVHMSKAYQS